jgi:hypothetical protein
LNNKSFGISGTLERCGGTSVLTGSAGEEMLSCTQFSMIGSSLAVLAQS